MNVWRITCAQLKTGDMHMNKCYAVSQMGILLVCLCLSVNAQDRRIIYREKKLQISSVPGISSSGLESGKYSYLYSFNLFSGVSAGTKYFSFATISNLGTRSSSGIQLAGFANVVGTHSYLHLTNTERKQLESEGKTPNQKGIQISGFLNFVRGESSGIQVTGGINNVNLSSSGFHLAGISNSTGWNMKGIQFSSVFNYSRRMVLGGQMGSFNYSGDLLSGFQIGLINRAKELDGKAINASGSTFGLQLGIINSSRTNNGIQIGLINRTRKTTGIQIGLINLFRRGPYPGGNEYNGIPIGLINLGSRDSRLGFSRSDVIPFTIEYTSGNCHNCTFTKSSMPIDDQFYKTNQNSLIFGFDKWNESEIVWAAGYGFHRVYYNKSSMSPNDFNNRRIYLSPAIRFIHLNKTRSLDPGLSLLTQLRFEVGLRVKRVTIFGGANANAYLYRENRPLTVSSELVNGVGKTNYQIWPGFVYGIKLQASNPLRDSLKEAFMYFFR